MFKSAHGVLAALNERLARRRRTSRRKHRARPPAVAGAIESLEDRRLLAVITVTSLLDTVEDRDEALTLREAILIANDSSGATSFEGISSTDVADTIVFDPDVFVSDSGPIFLSQQLPAVTELLTIDGAVNSHRVAIDGLNESRILENASAGLNLRNLILQNGFVFGDGGAILNSRDAVLDLNNVDVIDSTAALGISSFTVGTLSATGGCGGGIYNVTGGTVTITSSMLAGNTAEANGGGLFNEVGGTATITSAVLSGNSASVGGGFQNNGAATITGSAITSNTAKIDGGGVHNDGDLMIDASAGGVQISQNVANATSFGRGGGGIFNSGSLAIQGAELLSNNARASGGGILNAQGALTVIGSILEGNRSDEAGGLRNAGTATLTASTITGNQADSGGGITNSGTGTLVLDQTVISSNTARVGGGLLNSGTATLMASTVKDNQAHYGGGIFSSFGVRATLAITDSEVSGNSAQQSGGGLSNFGTVTITDTIISANTARLVGGGLDNGGTALLTASTVTGNQADRGGGLSNRGTATLTASVVAGNQAGSGGGVLNGTKGTLVLDQTIISSNIAAEGGGLSNSGTATVTATTITGNQADRGGGLSNFGRVTITDSTISGNTADISGGGILNEAGGVFVPTVALTDSEVSGNSAELGGGLYNRGRATITGGTVSDNQAFLGGGVWNGTTGTLGLDQTLVSSNIALADGGGIMNFNDLTVTGGVFAGNEAASGGALFNAGDATITGATIRDNSADLDGGGLYNEIGATVTITGSTIIRNSAEASGGGIYNSGDLTIQGRTDIRLNEASGTMFSHGGAIFNSGALIVDGSMGLVFIGDNTAQGDGGGLFSDLQSSASITETTFFRNVGMRGGGAYIGNSATAVITGSILEANRSADSGGGLFNLGMVTISASTVDGNVAHTGGGLYNDNVLVLLDGLVEGNHSAGDGSGGGAFNSTDGTMTIANSTFFANFAVNNGGGITNHGALTITGSTVSDGDALLGSGAGIDNSGELWIAGSTIARNDAADRGGGLYTRAGAVSLMNVTMAGNAAATGRGIVVTGGILRLTNVTLSALESVSIEGGVLEATSTIFAGNVSGPLTDLGFNLIRTTAGITFVGGPAPTTISGVDPLLAPLQDNGGPTFTHALLPGSPAINRGSNPTGVPFDQRGPGFNRTAGGRTDIGAFEVQTPRMSPGMIVVGSGLGAAPEIRIFDPDTNQLVGSFAPFPSFFRGGIRVATGDVNGDGVADIVASAAPKGPPRVRVFDGTDLTGGTVLMDFFAYRAGFGGGVFVATGDVNNDGRADIITSAGAGGGPRVKVFSGADLTGGTVLMNFLAYARHFRGGVKVAAGDINGDNRDDVITGTGAGGGPRVKVFSGADLTGGTALMNFLAYARHFRGGVQVAAGDVNGDGRDDVITGAGLGGGPRVRAFSGADLSGTTLLADFLAYDRSFRGGVRVATADVNGDGVVDIITGTGALGGSQVRAFDGLSGQGLVRFFASPPGSTRGVFVAGVSRRTTEPPPISAPSWGSGGSGLSSGSFQLVDDLFSDTLLLDQLQSL